jgi:hypothetical protein
VIRDDRHALYIGWVIGAAMRAGVNVEVLADEDGNYTGELRFPSDLGRIVLVVPYPPDDWTLADDP